MMSTPSISFVVPVYNYARYLGDCLRSIVEQDGDFDFEVIVIDDGSTDESWQVIEAVTDPRLKAFRHHTNLGHRIAISHGFEEARGEFIARIDADDRIRPYFLTRTMDKFQEVPGLALVYGNAAFMDEEGHITAPRTDFIHGGNDFLGNEFAALLEYDFINSPTVIARREAWRAAFPIPEELGRSALDDWFLAVKMARRYDFYYLDDVLADVRTHRGSLHTVSSLDGSDERFLDWFLSRIFEEEETRGFEISRGPLNRRRIRGAHSLSFGQRYFGLRMTSDARRCYIQAVRYQPRNLLKGSVLRQLLGTLIGLRTYERLKGMLRFAAPRKLPGSRFRGTGD